MGTKRSDYCDGKAALGNPDSMSFSANLDIKAPPIPAVSDSFALTAEMVISPARFITHTSADHTLLKSLLNKYKLLQYNRHYRAESVVTAANSFHFNFCPLSGSKGNCKF